jgi:two-component system CheB/CheR fusion protein
MNPPSPASPAEAGSPKFVIAGIGASAGGLDAISELLKALPASSALALLVVQHLDPEHESLLVELLNRISPLPVEWMAGGRTIQAGRVYVAPPKTKATLKDGAIVLENSAPHSRDSIDQLFRSLADQLRERAVGVVLSGTGADGAVGMEAIKAAGGLGFAQDDATAAFPSMPRAAIDAGHADRILPPARIASELAGLPHTSVDDWPRTDSDDDEATDDAEQVQLKAIFRLLGARSGVDFSEYKQTTIKRRLVRRMAIAKVSDIGDYTALLRRNAEEVDELAESLLINVTEFFRDREYFEFLRTNVIPGLLRQLDDKAPIRLWVPGCATGEETYSLGMLVHEQMQEQGIVRPVQIFGTDVSERAIALARAGIYSASDVANVGPERLQRFFIKTDRGYVIHKVIRDLCVFARQNVVKDSPFSRLDLISCRNLLIYLSPLLQRKLMPIFHYALNPGGYLVLGTSESVGAHADLYRLVDRQYRIYTRKPGGRRAGIEFSLTQSVPGHTAPPKPIPTMPDESKDVFDIAREADRIVLSRFGATGVLVNEELDILQFRGDVTPYLAPFEGRASLNLIKMAREGLASELQNAIHEAREKNIRVHRSDVTVMHGLVAQRIEIDVTPIEPARSKERFYLVLFSPALLPQPAEPEGKGAKGRKPAYLAQIEQLRQDLQATRRYLQAAIEKHETANQELRAANEEIQSSNEELQSTNEELETAKEELQATNEELTTVNEELHSRQLELIQLNNDLSNLINSVHLPIIILGQDLRIRRFTPMAEKVLNVIPTDIGRPLSDLNTNLDLPDLEQLINEVVESLTVKEIEVRDNRGRWYSIRLRPYKTSENKIEGVVITLIDIDPMKQTIAELEEVRDFAQAVIESTHEPMLVLNTDLRIKNANDAFHRLFGTTRDRALGQPLFEAINNVGQPDQLRVALDGVLSNHTGLQEHEIQLVLPQTGTTRLLVTARQVASGARTYPLIVLSLRRPG